MTAQKFDTISVCLKHKRVTPAAVQISVKMLNIDAVGGDEECCLLDTTACSVLEICLRCDEPCFHLRFRWWKP